MGWVEGTGSWSVVILLQIVFSIAQCVLKTCCIQKEKKAFILCSLLHLIYNIFPSIPCISVEIDLERKCETLLPFKRR